MVSDIVANGLFAIGGAIVGAVVQGWIMHKNTRARIEAEHDKQRAEYPLQLKANALRDLYMLIHECRYRYRVMDDFKSRGITEEEFSELHDLSESFQRATNAAKPHLDEDQLEKVQKFHEILVNANTYFDHLRREDLENKPIIELSDRIEDMWNRSNLFEAHERAIEALEPEINEPIEEFESD